PVANMSTMDSEGVPHLFSLNTTTLFPLGLFELVRTNTSRPSSSATANAVARNNIASMPPARHRLIFKVLSSFVGLEFAPQPWKQELTLTAAGVARSGARPPHGDRYPPRNLIVSPFLFTVQFGLT